VEAAARLAMLEDFDVRAFDGLCVALLGDTEHPEPGPLPDPAGPSEAPHVPAPSESPHERLCGWLLRLCDTLLDPASAPAAADAGGAARNRASAVDDPLCIDSKWSGGAWQGGVHRDVMRERGSRRGSEADIGGYGWNAGDLETKSESMGSARDELKVLSSSMRLWNGSARALSLQSGAALRFAFFEERVCPAQVPWHTAHPSLRAVAMM
jgi:hypothetical protein